MTLLTAEPITQPVTTVTIGVDTYSQLHHAAVPDQHGLLLADKQFTTDLPGYQQLLDWAASYDIINAAGVECTGSYGAGLTRFLLAAGVDVVEVNRGHRLTRSRSGKNDALMPKLLPVKSCRANAPHRPKTPPALSRRSVTCTSCETQQ